MCGIFCSLLSANSCQENRSDHNALEACLCNLKSRGPDSFQSMTCVLPSSHSLQFAASVLQTQGKQICSQPYEEDGNVLCWNGDVFNGEYVNEIHSDGLSDTQVISKYLSVCLKQGQPLSDVFNKIEGPYSFIFYAKEEQIIWFGRDPAGRHSLLFEVAQQPPKLILTSVGHSSLSNLKEVPAIGLFEVDLNNTINKDELCIYLHPWEELKEDHLKDYCLVLPQIQIKAPICEQYIFKPSSISHLKLVHDAGLLPSLNNIPIEFQMEALYNLKKFELNMLNVLASLEAAVKVRVNTNIRLCQVCVADVNTLNSCCHTKVAVLFSGGLDSAILAKLVDKHVPANEPIDLLNVAFEKKVSSNNKPHGKKKPTDEEYVNTLSFGDDLYNVPDRISGRKTLKELQNLCPERKWNFIEINIPIAELQEERSSSIGHLIHPLKTVLDDSLGCALWFAARGQGKIYESNEIYRSPARVVITGMGADEQFGGYMRHRTTLKNHGWEALGAQLQMELERIPSRNLGRDDRVISHHGRQPRMPFLDENVIRLVKALPPWDRCCPNDALPCGVGDKLLLRLVAWHIGLKGAAVFPKRALQFGSRIANSKENAAHTSDRL
ncbi:asparagine synthetase domain-containing protein 1 [Thrips palmi]|uniref:Asparagine synthetase domain-containing protein 1 n=1 Tax=Thrips palmi TaxID=161013 RepID=A0A6P9ABQ8_THRPL|nr:asparagine synthetase domain-containing protein 1 [Thrips palmi]